MLEDDDGGDNNRAMYIECYNLHGPFGLIISFNHSVQWKKCHSPAHVPSARATSAQHVLWGNIRKQKVRTCYVQGVCSPGGDIKPNTRDVTRRTMFAHGLPALHRPWLQKRTGFTCSSTLQRGFRDGQTISVL